MLKTRIVNRNDLADAVKLQKRVNFENERQQRIFALRARLLGKLDIRYLEKQIEENKVEREKERELDERYERETNEMHKGIYMQKLEQRLIGRAVEADTNYYRCAFQQKDQRREYDLVDPRVRRKTKAPLDCGPNESVLGMSCAQLFHGEDLNCRQRHREQGQQQRGWLHQQVKAKMKDEEIYNNEELARMRGVLFRDAKVCELATTEKRMRRQYARWVHDYNYRMAAQKREATKAFKAREMEDEQTEIHNMLNTDILSENPNADHSREKQRNMNTYRGDSAKELAQLREDQLQQLTDSRQRRYQMEIRDKEWERNALNIERELIIKQRQIDEEERHALRDNLEYNRIAGEQRKADNHKNRYLYHNRINEDFYNQFNKTSR